MSESINWSLLQFQVPENIKDYKYETQQSIFNYLIQLNPIQQKAFIIAKEHLGTSFHIMRSTGYIEWTKSLRV
jgi:hypothetical protein